MMVTARLKYIFYACSLLLLLLMLLMSSNAGITCDEVLHYNHSQAVFSFFKTHGADQSALNTPGTHLKYYGQSCDNIVTALSHWMNISDIYSLRHYVSALAGWLAIFISALFAAWLSGYRSGLLVLILFTVSPGFMGHAQNNLKDIPFALSYIAGTFFMTRTLFSKNGFSFLNILFLIISIGFSISIRSGGLVLICYMFLFFLVSVILRWIDAGGFNFRLEGRRLLVLLMASFSAVLLGILFWPYALQSPVSNLLESYRVMAHFPSTFRQIFEGQVFWSDLMPWYYLPKSMLITIPLIVLAGLGVFIIFYKKAFFSDKKLIFASLAFTILFPLFYVLIEKSNLYSSWRQFLFIYPAIIILSAAGFDFLFSSFKKPVPAILVALFLVILTLNPVRFMIKNIHYSYIYYNQFVGGLKGAYGNYETDYYYVSQTEASQWLIGYLKEKNIDSAKVMATFSVDWQFRNCPGIKTGYMRYEERSMNDWDYAIINNRYISPSELKSKTWPPRDAIHVVSADSVPLCAVLERKSKLDYQGFTALDQGRSKEAVDFFERALKEGVRDEMIFYNFARALYNDGQYARADSALKAGLEINPDFEPALMYLGNIAAYRNDPETGLGYYERLIRANRKYFQAYVESARLTAEDDVDKARTILKECLKLNPKYKPAIKALADTYRKTDPEIARKYDQIAETIE